MNRHAARWGVAALIGFSAAMSAAQTFKPVDSFTVVDANGKVLGPVLWNNYGCFEVALQVSGSLVRLDLCGVSFLNGSEITDAAVLFESSDCSGTAYIPPDVVPDDGAADHNLPLPVIGIPGLTAYIADPAAAPKQIRPQSYSKGRDNSVPPPCETGLPANTQSPVTAIRALPLIDLSAEFTPPFRLSPTLATAGAQCCGDCNGDGHVTINELVKGVNGALTGCPAANASTSSDAR